MPRLRNHEAWAFPAARIKSSNPAPIADSIAIFTMGNSILLGRRIRENRVNSRNPRIQSGLRDKGESATAQSPLHDPVNELHSIDSKAHTNLFFLLTQKIEGVQHNCSLTVTEFFRLVRRPGVKRGHLPQTARVLTQEKLGNQQI
jgi:hypothetical protein